MADDYDFQIGDLKFRAAVSDKFPYVRGTAPFRKEQFDSSGRAGDQSLTGWWTRGQLSFHKGAGLNFYEVQAGDEALDRFETSDQVNPWTPGEVTLSGATATHSAVAPSSVYSAAMWGDFLFAVESYTTAGDFYKDGVVVNTTSASAPQCCAVTTYLGGRVLVGVGRDIEVMLPTSSGPTTNLWTNDDMAVGVNYTHLFWAKDRIWGASSDGIWYVLDHEGGTVAAGGPERFWEHGTISLNWGLADTPGGVYISRDQFIWHVTVDPDTAALSTPRIVADLGEGAVIKCIRYNRGYLGICTERGFLVGFIQDSGDLTLGPMFLKYGESLCKSMVANGSSFFFVATHEDDLNVASSIQFQSVYEVNLIDEVATLQPTWAIRDRQFSSGGTPFCFPTSGTSQYVTVLSGATGVLEGQIPGPFVGEDYASVGTLTTAQHRMGTLELKSFQTLRVTAEVPTGDHLYVYAVLPDGTEDLQGEATTGQTDFPLVEFDPMESMAFKFRLEQTSGGTVKLLGYQVKALPVPERQRLIRLPLLIHDVIRLRGGTTVGTKGRAYDALAELEVLESTQAVVPFTDHRTGEFRQTVYIDQVEFQGDTPPNRSGGNFGGIAYVTLRII